jgi:hypothetical protein
MSLFGKKSHLAKMSILGRKTLEQKVAFGWGKLLKAAILFFNFLLCPLLTSNLGQNVPLCKKSL